MNNVFLRVFGGVFGALVVFALLAAVLFQLLNNVRYLQYQEERVSPLFRWVNEEPNVRLSFLEAVIPPGSFFQALARSGQRLSRLQQERLSYGQTLIKEHESGLHAFSLIDNDTVMVAYFADLPLESTLWAAQLISLQVKALPQESRVEALNRLAGFFKLSPRLAELEELGEWQGNKQNEFKSQGWAVLPGKKDQGSVLAVAFDDEQYIRFDELPAFNPWAWPVTLSLVIIGVLCLGASLFLLLEKLERRLRKLESVANSITRGELDARIDEDDRFDSVGRLVSVFNQMADHIQRLVAVQRETIHAVSHELRTPVARIRFGVQMIEDSMDEKSRAKQLAGIDRDIQELNELIDEILTYARLEQGGPILDFQDINIVNIVRQVVSEQQQLKPQVTIVAEFLEESERWCMSDVEPRYIHRSVQNLVGNATRYARSEVVIKAHFSAETCRIDVEDDGPGVPESDWEKVFTAFARLDDSRTRSSGGYGLGLSIVRRILYWHGGHAFLGHSQVLGGAKFTLVWPRRQE